LIDFRRACSSPERSGAPDTAVDGAVARRRRTPVAIRKATTAVYHGRTASPEEVVITP